MIQAVDHYNRVEDEVMAALGKPGKWYWLALLGSLGAFSVLLLVWSLMIFKGVGVTHLNNPVGWSTEITNFVFWVGIAHSGTLISAILFLFRAKYRNRFNRAAEAMTIFAVMTAGLFPLLHLGRVWVAYFLFPYPNQRLIWPNFRSPLVWDVFAVSTYFTVSAVFFYVGLIPDLAIARRRIQGWRRWLYKILSLGWVGSVSQWKHYNRLYALLAAFATPLVISVHSVVSWDFAMSIVPGWHTTIFAPYFVAGAILSGTAMVITLVIPMRKILNLERLITIKHFESLTQLLLLTSLIVSYAYLVEFALAFYSNNQYELGHFLFRATGDYRYCWYIMILCNSLIPLSVFIKKARTNLTWLFIMSLAINVGMWMERFVIITTALAKEYEPYAWGSKTAGLYIPNLAEVGYTVGSFGLFFTLFLLFTKLLPVLAVTEIKEESR